MQKAAAYLLERRDGMDSSTARSEEATRLKALVLQWLDNKGGTGSAVKGSYEAEDGSHATYACDEATDGARTWWLLRLEERTAEGRRVAAAVSVTNGSEKVAVYVTLEVGSDGAMIGPVEAEPRCPRVVRTLLDQPGNWYHGGSRVRRLSRIDAFDDGAGLADELLRPERTIPILVVSTGPDGGVVLPRLEGQLARDLAGLANVVVVGSDAAWALTDRLGTALSCWWGGVRLYWPRVTAKEDPARHPLWTPQRISGLAAGGVDARERFRGQLRRLVMRASALSVVRPKEMDDIRGASSRRAFAELKARASSLADYEGLAEAYARENDQFRARSADHQRLIEELQARVVELEAERSALVGRLRGAEGKLRYQRVEEDEDLAPDAPSDEDAAPVEGDVRFYKKHYTTPKHDVMVRVTDCGCDNWESAHAADKARKGIAKLEGGRNDWAKMEHCASCTGGGMWRVRW